MNLLKDYCLIATNGQPQVASALVRHISAGGADNDGAVKC